MMTVNREVLIFAFRYALGRMSYAPATVTHALLENIDNISDCDLELYIREINECVDYGMEFDKDHWMKFRDLLKLEQKKRQEK